MLCVREIRLRLAITFKLKPNLSSQSQCSTILLSFFFTSNGIVTDMQFVVDLMDTLEAVEVEAVTEAAEVCKQIFTHSKSNQY